MSNIDTDWRGDSDINTKCSACGVRRGKHSAAFGHCPSPNSKGNYGDSDRFNKDQTFIAVTDNVDTAKRFNEGKPRIAMNLVGREVAECEAKVWEMGAEKYGMGNWQKGQQLSTCMDSVLRHATAIMNGEFIDPESGLPHVGHLITASKIAAHSYLTKPELNDIGDDNG